MAPFDVSQLSKIIASMGLPPQLAEQARRDPEFLSILTRNVTQGTSGIDHESEQSVLSSKFASEFTSELESARAAHERERSLPPTRVPELPRYVLLAEFSGSPQSRSFGKAEGHHILTRRTYIGATPVFSDTKLGDLKRINISNMMVRKRHQGTYLLCRIISKTTHVVATEMAIEDPRGDTTKLAIYHYPFTLDASADEADTLFPIGAILALREPYYKLSLNGEHPMIRVDSPSDIVFVYTNSVLTENIRWRTGASIHHTPRYPETALGWKERGAEEFRHQRWLCAAIAFSDGLRLEPDHPLLLLNRAETYLRMGWFNSAVRDAQAVVAMNLDGPQLACKAVIRAAKAYYSLGQYEGTLRVAGTLPDDPNATVLSEKARRRIHERETGDYDLLQLFKESQGRAARLDVADYCGPVEVRSPQNGPRGLFLTSDVKMGDVLLVAKPLASCYAEDSPTHGKEIFVALNFLASKTDKKSQYALIDRLTQRMWDDANLALTIKGMHSGRASIPAGMYPISPVEVVPLLHPRVPVADIDIARIEAVCSTNSFSMGTHLVDSEESRDEVIPDATDTSSALYGLPSFCNHSCLPTAVRTFFGDVMMIRAKQNLKSGQEVTLSYFPVESTYTAADKRAELTKRQWGFTCRCSLCLAERSDTPIARTLRSQLAASRPQSISGHKRLVDQLKKTYSDTRERRLCGVKPELFMAYSHLGGAYRTAGLPRECVKTAMDALEAAGINITDRSISGRSKRKSEELPVDSSRGPSAHDPFTTHLVIHISSAFVDMGERQRACDWLKVAVWLEDISVGGGSQMFFERFKSFLATSELTGLFRSAFNIAARSK